MITSHVHIKAWVPLGAALSNEDVVAEDFGVVAPLLDTESATGGVLLVVSVSTHDFGSEGSSR